MKITILTYGSRGDVQPFLPLSLKLMEAGHAVKLAAPFRFKNLVEEHKIDFVPLSGDPEDLSRRLNDAGHNFVRLLGELMSHTVQIGADIWRQTEEACKGADLIIHTFTHAIGGHTLAREKNIPDIHIQTFPMFAPTGDYPNIMTLPGTPSIFNRFTHEFSAKITWWTARLGFERVRRRAGLPKRKLYWSFEHDPLRPRTPILCAWSPSVLPASSDWPSRVHVTGYYFFPQNSSYRPPAELVSFLQKGELPVTITFGSMVNRDKERIGKIVRESLKQTNHRGIILSGWSGIKVPSSNDLFYLDVVPHDWLLPRCRMVIHHGGAGTTAAGLRAGIPNIVIPFMGDQPFWGDKVHAIGAGPKPILVKNLSIQKLSQAIAEADQETIHRRAQGIGQQVRNEDGTSEAARWIEKYSNDFQREH
ncbi:MAG TPA: glycosyltransferase [Anaerolineales bacterium]|nr:glycosyltransferase [Anaerolineales bacterium]